MTINPFEDKQPVQYLGESGITQTCILAIKAILNSGILPEKVTIVTNVSNRRSIPIQEKHLFIFWNWQYTPVVVIPSGFASGYTGEGPRGFALAICLIREKQIPIDNVDVEESTFNAIDKGELKYADDQILKSIKAKSETMRWPFYDWVPPFYEEALEKERLLRHSYLGGYKTDLISSAISNISLFNSDIGAKIRKAKDAAESGITTEEWQHSGQLIRDAWIELVQQICNLERTDTSGMRNDSVSERLKELPISEKTCSLAKASFDLNSEVRHNRSITQEVAISCVMSSIFVMQSIIYKYIDTTVEFK